MRYADDIILATGFVALLFGSYCREGLRWAFKRWVDHRDHVAELKYGHRVEAPDVRENSHI